jgi:hypothetical protein
VNLLNTYAAMREAFAQTVGDSQNARAQANLCLTEGQRNIANGLDLPELQAIDESVVVATDDDFVEVANVDLDIFAIMDAFNVTKGYEIFPEPGGMVGRNRFLDTTGKPQTGDITHYIRDGRNIYVRGTPSEDTTLRFRCRQQAPEVLDSNLNDEPILPMQHRLAAIYAAAEVFYNLNPRNEAVGNAVVSFSQKYRDAKQSALAETKASVAEEDKSRRQTMRLTGYRCHPRSRSRR